MVELDRTQEDINQDERLDALEAQVQALQHTLELLKHDFVQNDLLARVIQLEDLVL